MSKVHGYAGQSIRVSYDPARCIHAAECVRGLPEAFDPERKPWIDPDAGDPDRIAEVIERCPTGALQYERLDGREGEQPDPVTTITVCANGPVFVRGRIEILDADRNLVATETRAAFCRCGASASKPWCDGSHADVGFEARAELGETRPKPASDPTSRPLTVRLRPGGPLVLDGPFRIRAETEDEWVDGGGCALCRCGASSTKPFCDGSHNEIGFATEDPAAS